MPEAAVAAPPAAPAQSAPPANAAKESALAALDAINDHSGDGPQPEPSRAQAKAAPAKETAKADEPPKERPKEAPKDSTPSDDFEDQDPPKPAEAVKPAEPKPGEKPTEPPADGKPAEGNARKSGWQMYRELEKTHKALEAERDTLKKEIESIRSNPEAVKNHPEFKTMAERVEQATKRAQDLDEHMRYVDYTQSTEYKEQFLKPYEQTAELATNRATQLKVIDEAGNKRPLSVDEFWGIVKIPNENDAIEAAEKLFGEGSPKVAALIERRNEIVKAHQAMEGAKEKYRKEGSERMRLAQENYQKHQAAVQQQAEARQTKFIELVTLGEKNEKMKDVFAAAESDKEGAELLAKYRHEADRAFAGGVQLNPKDEPWTPEQLLAKHAVLRNRAGAFPYAVRQLRQANAKIAELESKLKSYQKSEPSDGEIPTGEAPPISVNPFQAALAKAESLQ